MLRKPGALFPSAAGRKRRAGTRSLFQNGSQVEIGSENVLKYIGKRLLAMIPVVLGVTLIVYCIMSLAPGDPARTILGEQATEVKIPVTLS